MQKQRREKFEKMGILFRPFRCMLSDSQFIGRYSMTVADPVNSLFTGMYHAGMLSKVWSIASHNERVPKRNDSRDVSIPEVVKILLSDEKLLSFPIAGPMLVGLCRLYGRHMDLFLGKLHSSVLHLDSAPKHQEVVPSTVKRRKRSVLGIVYDTPLRTIPEDASLAYIEDVLFENSQPFPPLLPPLTRTPISGRKRVSWTPRSSETVFGISTPTMDESAKRQRRISSLSEVMDTLRADDGQRRMSGLLGTTGNVGSFHESNEDDFFDYAADFDTGIDPPQSPLGMIESAAMLSNGVVPRSTRQPTIRTYMDRKDRIDQSSVEREKILNYFKVPRIFKNGGSLLLRSDFISKKNAHVLWYIKSPIPTMAPSAPYPEDDDQPYEDIPVFEEQPYFEDIRDEKKSLGSVLKCMERSKAASSFMEILHLANQGKIHLTRTIGPIGFSSIDTIFPIN